MLRSQLVDLWKSRVQHLRQYYCFHGHKPKQRSSPSISRHIWFVPLILTLWWLLIAVIFLYTLKMEHLLSTGEILRYELYLNFLLTILWWKLAVTESEGTTKTRFRNGPHCSCTMCTNHRNGCNIAMGNVSIVISPLRHNWKCYRRRRVLQTVHYSDHQVVTSLLLILAGDVETNPGPGIDADDITILVQDDSENVIDELKNVLEPYYEIGRRLHLSADKLKQIRGQKLSAGVAMDEVIMEWLKKNYDVNKYKPPTWKALVDAVEHPAGGNNRAEAEKIASRHRPKPDQTSVEDGASKDGASKDGASKDGASKDGASKDGASKDGASKDGASKDGASTDGASKDGASKDGASEDGASKDGASNWKNEGPLEVIKKNINRLESVFSKIRDEIFDQLNAKTPNVRQFQSRFIHLSLESKKEHKSFLNEHIINISEKTTFHELWVKLGGYINFLNCTLLNSIICKFGDEKINKRMDDYLKLLKEFRKNTRLCDFAKCCPVLFHESLKENLQHFISAKLKQEWESCTLENLEDLKSDIIEHFNLPPFVLILNKVEFGCMKVTWAVSKEVASFLREDLENTSDSSREFCKKHGITSMNIGSKECRYSPAEAVLKDLSRSKVTSKSTRDTNVKSGDMQTESPMELERCHNSAVSATDHNLLSESIKQDAFSAICPQPHEDTFSPEPEPPMSLYDVNTTGALPISPVKYTPPINSAASCQTPQICSLADPSKEEALIRKMIEWERGTSRESSIKMVIVGQTGAGKSSLANFLTASGAIESCSTASCTTTSEKITNRVGRDEIIVWDTPDFTMSDRASTTRYLSELKKTRIGKEECDVLLYAIDMRKICFSAKNDGNIEVMKKLSETFNHTIWKNAVIILTYANILIKTIEDQNPQDGVKKCYDEKLDTWKKKVCNLLTSSVVPEEIAQDVKIVPAGFRTRSHLTIEPERPSWVSDLWFSILHAAKSNAKPVIMRILMNRIFDTNQSLKDSYNGEMLKYLIPKIQSTYEQRAVKLAVECNKEKKASVGRAWGSLYFLKTMLKNTRCLESDDTLHIYSERISSSVVITVVGESESGKTTLINSLFYGERFLPEVKTRELCCHDIKHENVTCRVWDTPGLQIEFNNTKPMINCDSVKNLGLFLLCIRIGEDKNRVIGNIEKITREHGDEVWRHALIVLTHANVQVYDKTVEPWTKFIRKYLKEVMGPDNDYSEGVKIVPAGYKNEIIRGDPTQTYWVAKLWMEIIALARPKFQPALVQMSLRCSYNRYIARSADSVVDKQMKEYFQHELIELLNKIKLEMVITNA